MRHDPSFYDRYLSAMAPGGTIFPLGLSGGNFSIPYMPILSKGLRIQGVLVAGKLLLGSIITIAASPYYSPECPQ
jgi:D-arabinose 1-dehydrogenase-like Zn-dependent alcohol dehydrogenase